MRRSVLFPVLLLFLALISSAVAAGAQQIAIVADEFHATQVLASQVEADTGMKAAILGQTELPESLSGYRAVVVYLHGELHAAAEHKFIQYANDGGNLVLLHHSISSGKRANKDWFNFLHIELPNRPLADGGYAYFDPVSYDVVDLAPDNPITTHKVTFAKTIAYEASGEGTSKPLPATTFDGTEVYLDHVLNGPRTSLLGM